MASTQAQTPAPGKRTITNRATNRRAFQIATKAAGGSHQQHKIIEIGGRDDVGIVGAQPNPIEVDADTYAALSKIKGFKALVDKGELQIS